MTLTDTGALLALLDADDPYYTACVAAAQRLPAGPLLTTWVCFTEAMYLLGTVGGYRYQAALWSLRATGRLVLHDLTPAEADRMEVLMAQYQDTPMDLADASLVVVAESRASRRVFTTDSDFYVYRLADGSALDVVPLPRRRFRQHAAPNQALEPTASSFGSAALRLRYRRRLTASVRLLLRSLVAWRGPEKKQTKQDRPRPHARCPRGHRRHPRPSQAPQQVRPQAAVGRPPVPPDDPVHAGGWGVRTLRRAGLSWLPAALAAVALVACARPCWRSRTHRGLASCPPHREHGRGVGGWRAVRCRRRDGVSWRAWGWSSVAGGHGRRRGPCGGPAAPGTHREGHAAGRSGRAGGRRAGGPLGRSPCQPPSRKVLWAVPTWVAAVGPREAWAPAAGPQPPNKGLQATPNSLRSCLAPALGRA